MLTQHLSFDPCRLGAFECDPTLVRHCPQEVDGGDSEEPPVLSYTGYHDNSDSDSEADLSAGLEGEWEALDVPPLAPPLEGERSVEMEAYRERMRHLNYNSTYLDYMSMGCSEQVGVARPSGSSVEPMDSTEEEGSDGGGLLGTISSLWSSTFGRTT